MKKRLISGLIILAVSVGIFSNAKVSAAIEPIGVYRLYNKNSGEHFYTKNIVEEKFLEKAGWKYEGISFYHEPDGVPIYRLYVNGAHHYTKNEGEKNALVKLGWKYEGIAFNVAKTGKPIYRLYNPKLPAAASHHYTDNINERNALIAKYGWKDEGIAWYTSDPYANTTKPTDEAKPNTDANANNTSDNTSNSNTTTNNNSNTNSSNNTSNTNNSSSSNSSNSNVNPNTGINRGDLTEADMEVIRTRFIKLLNEYRSTFASDGVRETPVYYDNDVNKLAKVRATESAKIYETSNVLTHDRVGLVSGATQRYIYDEPEYASIKNKLDINKNSQIAFVENLLVNHIEEYGPDTKYRTRQEALNATAELFFNQWKGSAEHNRGLLNQNITSIGLSVEFCSRIEVTACFLGVCDF